jgi:hypothetical protein
MASRADLQDWVLHALHALGGRALIPDISKHIWDNHEADLRASGKLFYTWQYDMRWAGQLLQQRGKLNKLKSPPGMWELR